MLFSNRVCADRSILPRGIFGLSIRVASILIALSPAAVAWKWPDGDIVAGFAQPQLDSNSIGIAVSPDSQSPIYPLESGELIFHSPESGRPSFSSVPSALGNFVIIEHSNNLRSVYANMQHHFTTSSRVESDTAIGIAGENASIDDIGYHIIVLDHLRNSIVNPLALLPAIEEQGILALFSASLKYDKRTIALPFGSIMEIPLGKANLTLQTYTRSSSNSFSAANALPLLGGSIVWNGAREVFEYSHIAVENGEWVIPSLGPLAIHTLGYGNVITVPLSIKPGRNRLSITLWSPGQDNGPYNFTLIGIPGL